MRNKNSKTSRVSAARGQAAVWSVLAIAFSALAWAGQPLAYVIHFASNSISVIDTGDNTVVDTMPVGHGPEGIAVVPDGKHVYVAIVALYVVLVTGILWLNIWHHKCQKLDKIRRAKLTPEELEEEDYRVWCDSQW